MAEMSLMALGGGRGRVGDFGFGGFAGPTGSMTQPGAGAGWGGTIASILSAAAPIVGGYLASRNQPSMSMGMGFAPALTGLVAPAVRAAAPYVVGAGAGLLGGLLGNGNGGELFGTSAERVRPMRNVPVKGPDDRLYWFGYLGRPVLWSGDLAAARRVQRVARRAGRPSLRRRAVRRRR